MNNKLLLSPTFKKVLKIFVAGSAIFLVVTVLVIALKTTENVFVEPLGDKSKQTICENEGGQYSAKYNECSNISLETCSALQGGWSGCASPCRHDPDATVCITSCDQFCTL